MTWSVQATTYNVHVVVSPTVQISSYPFICYMQVAAGNNNIDANYVSPASASNVITVGASNISDYRWNMSNWGSCLTLFAPGENVISCGTSGPYVSHACSLQMSLLTRVLQSTSVKSGTSMATPHVAGLIACLISKEGNISPWNMLNKVYNMSLKNVLYYIRTYFPIVWTSELLTFRPQLPVRATLFFATISKSQGYAHILYVPFLYVM